VVAIPACAHCERSGRVPPYEPLLRLLAVDDESPVLEELAFLLRADPRVASVGEVTNAVSAVRVLHKELDSEHPLDAVFLDVGMPGLNGLEIARLLSRFAAPPAVVFVTAHEDGAVEAFELKALDYLLKPVRPERLADAVHRVLHAVDARATAEATMAGGDVPQVTGEQTGAMVPADDRVNVDDETIPVELGGTIRFVKRSEVGYVEAQGDYVRLHTAGGSFLVRTAMSTVEDRWGPAGFIRIHRSYLVSSKRIKELRTDAGRLTVRVAGVVLPVSRRHAKQLRDMLVRQARVSVHRAETS
jgi:two-component system, LytTR family, response regulator LytT